MVNFVSYLGVLNSHCSLVVISVVIGDVILASHSLFSSASLGACLACLRMFVSLLVVAILILCINKSIICREKE